MLKICIVPSARFFVSAISLQELQGTANVSSLMPSRMIVILPFAAHSDCVPQLFALSRD